MHERAVTFARLTRSQFESDAAMFNAVVENTHRLMRWIETLEARGVERARIQRAIAPAVAAIAGSPFVARLHTWPRGYPGDFETIEYLCDGINRAEAGTLGFFCESYYLNSAPACQHRNKLQAQAARISALIRRKPDASILVLAAGGGRDLLQALPWLEASRARLVVNDLEPDAVHLCQQRLATLGDRVTLVPGDALAIGRFRALGPFDLIVAGGLFDYLPTPVLIRALRLIQRALLRADGELFFTNIVEGHAFRAAMDYLLNWSLIGRSPEDLLAVLQAAGISADRVRITPDLTMLAWLVDVTPA
jgi:hypothetical protein